MYLSAVVTHLSGRVWEKVATPAAQTVTSRGYINVTWTIFSSSIGRNRFLFGNIKTRLVERVLELWSGEDIYKQPH